MKNSKIMQSLGLAIALFGISFVGMNWQSLNLIKTNCQLIPEAKAKDLLKEKPPCVAWSDFSGKYLTFSCTNRYSSKDYYKYLRIETMDEVQWLCQKDDQTKW
jgi:hypothetical protein